MAGNSWQQPVSGEPSCGTYHPLAGGLVTKVNAAVWSSGSDYEIDYSGQVPVGTKAVETVWYITGGTGSYITVENAARDTGLDIILNYAQKLVSDHATLTVDSNRKAYFVGAGGANITVYSHITGYYI